jgi:predicted nucleic acid-binding protein
MTDGVYIDTSCVLKLIVDERDSDAVRMTCGTLSTVVVSSLAELETRSRLLALRRAGVIREFQYKRSMVDLHDLLAFSPFQVEPLNGDVFDQAITQVKLRGAKACKSLDRLHLAAMQVLGLKSILTKDARQAAVAKSLGFTVV